jgi:hypothetical protein
MTRSSYREVNVNERFVVTHMRYSARTFFKCRDDGLWMKMFDQRSEKQVHQCESRSGLRFRARNPGGGGRVGTLFWKEVGSGEKSVITKKF